MKKGQLTWRNKKRGKMAVKPTTKSKPSVKHLLSPKESYLKAMLAFQSEVPELPQTEKGNTENGNTYWWTPLPMIKKIVQPYLTKHGFVYRWDFKDINNKIEGTCILTHIEGHSETASMTVDKDNSVDMNNVQAVGSTRTYLQRYTIIPLLGLTFAEKDNDGKSAKSKKEIIPDPRPKKDGKHNEVVQEILFETTKEGGEDDSSKKQN